MTNTITITGRLGRDAELRYTKQGRPVLNFDLADSRSKPDGNNGWVEARPTIWHKATIWGALAEMWANGGLLVKGAEVEVSGELTIREYEHQGQQRWESAISVKQLGVREPRNSQGQPQNSFAQSQGVDDPWSQPAQGEQWAGQDDFSGSNDPNIPPF